MLTSIPCGKRASVSKLRSLLRLRLLPPLLLRQRRLLSPRLRSRKLFISALSPLRLITSRASSVNLTCMKADSRLNLRKFQRDVQRSMSMRLIERSRNVTAVIPKLVTNSIALMSIPSLTYLTLMIP